MDGGGAQGRLLRSSRVSTVELCLVRTALSGSMLAVLAWDVVAFADSVHHQPWQLLKWLAFLSRWTLLLVVLYLFAAAVATHRQWSEGSLGLRLLWAGHSVALPASLAVVPLYWGKLLVQSYDADRLHAVSFFVHGYNAVVMLTDFWLCNRRWHFADGLYVLGYGFLNMSFMFAYFHLNPDCPKCDLDTEGNPYVYSVIDWRLPGSAVLNCLLAILIPVPLLSAGLARASSARWRTFISLANP